MRTYVKIYGPPILKTIKALEQVVLDIPEVCIMSMPLSMTIQMSSQTTGGGGPGWPFSSEVVRRIFGANDLPQERCETIISKSSQSLGEYDFFFEWFQKPTVDQIKELIEKIDEAVKPLGSLYTVTTK
jgi:hypothetical protein